MLGHSRPLAPPRRAGRAWGARANIADDDPTGRDSEPAKEPRQASLQGRVLAILRAHSEGVSSDALGYLLPAETKFQLQHSLNKLAQNGFAQAPEKRGGNWSAR